MFHLVLYLNKGIRHSLNGHSLDIEITNKWKPVYCHFETSHSLTTTSCPPNTLATMIILLDNIEHSPLVLYWKLSFLRFRSNTLPLVSSFLSGCFMDPAVEDSKAEYLQLISFPLTLTLLVMSSNPMALGIIYMLMTFKQTFPLNLNSYN